MIFDEFNRFQNELNESAQESMQYAENKSYSERNENSIAKKPRKRSKIFSTFMFACASVAVLPIGVYVPLFSEVFSVQPVEEVVIDIKPEYNISINEVTFNKVNCSIKLTNVDFEKENYYVYVVKEVDASDSFLAGVSESVKQNYRTKLTTTLTNLTFTKFMHSYGGEELISNSNYAVILVCNGKIVCKQLITTEKYKYVKDVIIKTDVKDKTNRYLDIKVVPNDEFEDFNTIYYELYNLSTNTLNPDYYSVTDKAYLSDSYARFSIKLMEPVYDYELRIYCSTNHPEKLNYTSSFSKDDITYYMIYTYEEKIHF